jgi:aspartate oxidase
MTMANRRLETSAIEHGTKKKINLNPEDFKTKKAYMKAYMKEYHNDYKNKVKAKRNVLAHTVIEKLGLFENRETITRLRNELDQIQKENKKLIQKVKSTLSKKVDFNYQIKIDK